MSRAQPRWPRYKTNNIQNTDGPPVIQRLMKGVPAIQLLGNQKYLGHEDYCAPIEPRVLQQLQCHCTLSENM